MWKLEQRVVSENEPELGLGWIAQMEDRTVDVYFPKAQSTRRYAAANAPIRRFVFERGRKFSVEGRSGLVIEEIRELDGFFLLQAEGVEYSEAQILGAQEGQGALDLFATGFVTSFEAYQLRQDLQELDFDYSTSDLKGLLGSRVQLLNHQLSIAKGLSGNTPVRAILADEVGLGKTIEAGLVFTRMKKLGLAERALIVIPESLQTQWMSEFYRKFFEIFTWTDLERWEQDQISQQKSTFAVSDRVLISVETLRDHPHMLEDLLNHQWDLVIFDEAHKLCEEDFQNSSFWKMAKGISQSSKGVLLLSATPERAGSNTFEGLEALLDSPSMVAYRNRRKNFPGFPERRALRYEFKGNQVSWLLEFLRDFPATEKLLIITESSRAAARIHKELVAKHHARVALFTREQDFITRDKQAAWFASTERESAQILVSSSLGGEGRNFQCTSHLLLWDMPQSSDTLEQRIGRIDRIGQGPLINIHVPVEKGSNDEIYFDFFAEGTKSFKEFCPFAYEIEKEISVESFTDSKTLLAKTKKLYAKALSVYEKSLQLDSRFVSSPLDEEIRENLLAWERQNTVKHCLLGVLDCFDVDYKVSSKKDSFHIQADAMMFLESFPGLSDNEGKSITFDRQVALEREDFEYISVEHPFFEGAHDVFYQNHQGKVGLAAWKNPTWRCRFLLSGFFVSEDGSSVELFVDEKGKEVDFDSLGFDTSAIEAVPKSMAEMAAKRAAGEVSKPLASLQSLAETKYPKEDYSLDSFFLYLPTRGGS
ncbi:DEAD/DEAH box helicase family protein [bacterium]|nr:DEAD/DEAH box helicase family protein [bacterium]